MLIKLKRWMKDKLVVLLGLDLLQRHVESLQSNLSNVSLNLEKQLKDYQANVSLLKDRVIQLDRRFTGNNTAILQAGKSDEKIAEVINQVPYFDYMGFENSFRGSEDLIKSRQKAYLKYLKNKKKVLDIGSGRGEFLELLKAVGIKGIGVDQSIDMVLYCKEKGLDVYQNNALEFLNEQMDNIFDGIFIGQLVEHLKLDYLNALIDLCYKKLREDGVLIIETVNPHCDQAIKWFFLDPTHEKPVFPEFLQYLVATKGFSIIDIEYLTPTVESEEQLDRTLYGDYALIATKRVNV